ncbi:MAG: sterol desaturase family protein [Planctomycetaceae bacterium]|nr:sterol desaturase family protein [Planctomycetaceae bacterium]
MTIGGFTLFWTWETFWPFIAPAEHRLRHAGRNVAIAIANRLMLAILFGSAIVGVVQISAQREWGLLRQSGMSQGFQFLMALLLLDGWMYVWHRANHRIPFLWRFHRMHHSDRSMDVTTATRFHIGEHLISSLLKLGLIPLFGLSLGHLLLYETLVVGITMFHHANISLGRCDAWLRWILVTPFMHKVHHSREHVETDSNFSTVFSVWDHLARSYRMRTDCATIAFGLQDLADADWQTIKGMLITPLVSISSRGSEPEDQ